MSDFRETLVLGVGRSGSNLLSAALRKVDGNAGFFEIFFPLKAQGLQHFPAILARLCATMGLGPSAFDDPAFLAARDADPVAFFDGLSAAAEAEGHRSMTCKIFVEQLSVEALRTLLRRPKLTVIFLTRSRIHRHISGRKGMISGEYVGHDTTGLRPRLELRDFLGTAFAQDDGLEAFRDAVIASGVRHAYLNYERDLDRGQERLIDRVTQVLRWLGMDPRFVSTGAEGWLVKQDTTVDWRDKIENGFEVATALSGLGLLDYAQSPPLANRPQSPLAEPAPKPEPRNDALLDEGGYNLAFCREPVITFTAIQFGRSFMAEWMAGPTPAFDQRRGVHFLKPTWTMETTDLRPLAAILRRAESDNPGHHFVAMHVSEREAEMYRDVGIRTIPGNPNLFIDERHFVTDGAPHPTLSRTDAVYVARLAPWKNHHLASQLDAPYFVYGNPVEPSEAAQFQTLQDSFAPAQFINHRLGLGQYHYLGRQELASVLSAADVALALSTEEGCMRASIECLLAGLPMVSVPSIGGRDQFFTSDTALIVDPTPQAVRAGVAALRARNLGRDEVRRATLDRLQMERARFLDAANRAVAAVLGPMAPEITLDPLRDFVIRYVPLRKMIENLS